jgi:phosphoribosyl-ATP pyrophosphohydrolase/phosphoribosyl-AMP cyclohydrolase
MNIDFSKNTDGLIPAIMDSETKTVLMLGYMMHIGGFKK